MNGGNSGASLWRHTPTPEGEAVLNAPKIASFATCATLHGGPVDPIFLPGAYSIAAYRPVRRKSRQRADLVERRGRAGAERTAFNLTTQILNLMTDPYASCSVVDPRIQTSGSPTTPS